MRHAKNQKGKYLVPLLPQGQACPRASGDMSTDEGRTTSVSIRLQWGGTFEIGFAQQAIFLD